MYTRPQGRSKPPVRFGHRWEGKYKGKSCPESAKNAYTLVGFGRIHRGGVPQVSGGPHYNAREVHLVLMYTRAQGKSKAPVRFGHLATLSVDENSCARKGRKTRIGWPVWVKKKAILADFATFWVWRVSTFPCRSLLRASFFDPQKPFWWTMFCNRKVSKFNKTHCF